MNACALFGSVRAEARGYAWINAVLSATALVGGFGAAHLAGSASDSLGNLSATFLGHDFHATSGLATTAGGSVALVALPWMICLVRCHVLRQQIEVEWELCKTSPKTETEVKALIRSYRKQLKEEGVPSLPKQKEEKPVKKKKESAGEDDGS